MTDIEQGISDGIWTVKIVGGPGLWPNMVAMLEWAASDHPTGSAPILASRASQAEATFAVDSA